MDTSILITLSIPLFFGLVLIEFLYGYFTKNNNYRLNDAITSMSLGLISRFVPLLGLGFQYVVYTIVAEQYNLKLLNTDAIWVWVLAFLMYDLCYYWMHRIHHEVKLFWATHVVHHHGEDFNLSTAMRQTSTGFLWKWVFFLPMFLIGVPPAIYVTVAGLNLIYQFWVHTEHIGRLGWMEYVFITPSNHRVHHAQNDDYLDANYGGVFILWDRMFGTFIDEREDLKPVYGTVKPLKTFNPFWANIEVFYQMLMDSIRTKKWSDKVKVWFSPPAWRPADVAEKYPITKNDLSNFKKHDPQIMMEGKIFALFQFFVINAMTLVMLFNVNLFDYSQMLSIIFFIVFVAISNSFILDGKSFAYRFELLRAITMLFLFQLEYFTKFDLFILSHSVASVILAFLLNSRATFKAQSVA